MIDLGPFVASVESIVARHALERPGAFARYTRPGDDEHGAPRDLGANPYGCADAANLLYTLGRLPAGGPERDGFVAMLRDMQEPETGLYRESTHDPIHTTAHCLAALELFDAAPRHPLAALREIQAPDRLEAFLDALDWTGAPWTEAHRGAGVHAAWVLAGESTPELDARYFGWLEREVDPRTGLLRRGAVDPSPAGGAFPHLASTFHYLFNFEHARRRWPHPDALVDTCLATRADGTFPLAAHVWFADVDWVYCLARAHRQTRHRFEEVESALADFAAEYAAFVLGLDADTDMGLDDLHRLFGVVCALAELQQAARGVLHTPRPLRLVLDRRPFI